MSIRPDNASVSEIVSEAATRAAIDTIVLASITANANSYKPFVERTGSLNEGNSAVTRTLGTAGTTPATTTPLSGASLFYIPTSNFAVTGLTTKLSLHASLITNATSVGTCTYTVHLYPVTAVAGGADVFSLTLGSSQTSVAFVDPAASTIHQSTAADITMPSAGLYGLFLHNSAVTATDALVAVTATLRYRHV